MSFIIDIITTTIKWSIIGGTTLVVGVGVTLANTLPSDELLTKNAGRMIGENSEGSGSAVARFVKKNIVPIVIDNCSDIEIKNFVFAKYATLTFGSEQKPFIGMLNNWWCVD